MKKNQTTQDNTEKILQTEKSINNGSNIIFIDS